MTNSISFLHSIFFFFFLICIQICVVSFTKFASTIKFTVDALKNYIQIGKINVSYFCSCKIWPYGKNISTIVAASTSLFNHVYVVVTYQKKCLCSRTFWFPRPHLNNSIIKITKNSIFSCMKIIYFNKYMLLIMDIFMNTLILIMNPHSLYSQLNQISPSIS